MLAVVNNVAMQPSSVPKDNGDEVGAEGIDEKQDDGDRRDGEGDESVEGHGTMIGQEEAETASPLTRLAVTVRASF